MPRKPSAKKSPSRGKRLTATRILNMTLQLSLLLTEATALGLMRTARKIHEAQRTVGWEMAEKLEKEETVKRGPLCKQWPRCGCIMQGRVTDCENLAWYRKGK